MDDKLTWTDIEDVALALTEAHPGRDPLSVRFTELRKLVESLPEFEPGPGKHVNEQILEAVQAAWHDEAQGIERDEDDPGYTPPVPYKPDGR